MSEPALKRAKNPAPVTTLLDDEAFLGTWQPDFFTFFKRALLLGACSSLLLAPFSVQVAFGVFYVDALNIILAFAVFIVLLAVFSLLALFVFDDHLNWIRHRNDVWHLTSFRLIYENQLDPTQNATTNLQDINTTKRILWKTLRIRLFTGQAVLMQYLARPRSVERDIDLARLALMGTIADEADIPEAEPEVEPENEENRP